MTDRAGTIDRRGGERSMGLIVVGVDNSAGGKAALRFAVEEARLRRATLRAVHAWQFGYIGATGLEGALPVVGGELDDFRRCAAGELDSIIDDAVADGGAVEIERRADQGPAAAVLVDESRRADLLVVGSRGHGGLPACCSAPSAMSARSTPSVRS